MQGAATQLNYCIQPWHKDCAERFVILAILLDQMTARRQFVDLALLLTEQLNKQVCTCQRVMLGHSVGPSGMVVHGEARQSVAAYSSGVLRCHPWKIFARQLNAKMCIELCC